MKNQSNLLSKKKSSHCTEGSLFLHWSIPLKPQPSQREIKSFSYNIKNSAVIAFLLSIKSDTWQDTKGKMREKIKHVPESKFPFGILSLFCVMEQNCIKCYDNYIIDVKQFKKNPEFCWIYVVAILQMEREKKLTRKCKNIYIFKQERHRFQF